MTSNLYEFLAMVTLVSATTFAVGGFRYFIYKMQKQAEAENLRRQPELEALKKKYESRTT